MVSLFFRFVWKFASHKDMIVLFVDLHVVKVNFLAVKNRTQEDSLRFYICKFFNLVWTIGCTVNENLNWYFRSGGWGGVGRNLYIVLVYGSNKFRSMVRMWNFIEKSKEAMEVLLARGLNMLTRSESLVDWNGAHVINKEF